jgi:DNA invertase Pin-like site-specific DNA recombinase
MNDVSKIQAHHLKRSAYLYVRQSSMRQVLENLESSKRQYALQGRAIALGWQEDQVVVIDNDQGESGASATWREGFRHLVSEVSMGRAGIVMGLEVSRLARNNADWHQLLEICAFANTLILDEDGVYDPGTFNDRLLLGLKGTMSEAELHVLKARLRGGILNKVRRGEYRCQLPTGFVYNELGSVVLDPDTQVRETIAYFFETFERVGSASQTVKVFRSEGLKFPSRYRNQNMIVRPLTLSTALRILNNPRYAGIYSYGRRLYRRSMDGQKTVQQRHDAVDWLACIPDAHPGYITQQQYHRNLAILKSNGRPYTIARNAPPREGAALLQGRVVCGRCGNYMGVRYAARRGKQEAWYVCYREHTVDGDRYCQSIAAAPVDQVISDLIQREVTPSAVTLALEIRREIETQFLESDQLHERAVQRAQIEADLARRRFMLVDPANRLVADTLEGEWNQSLRALAVSRDELARAQDRNRQSLNGAVEQRLTAMTSDFATLWKDQMTANRERKRLLAYIIEDATLVKSRSEKTIVIHVRFRGGKTETLEAQAPRSSAEMVRTTQEMITQVDSLMDDYTYPEIAAILNGEGLRPSGTGRNANTMMRFDAKRVAYIAKAYNLTPRFDRLRRKGFLTRDEVARKLGIHEATVAAWARSGLITAHKYNDHFYLFEVPDSLPKKHCSRWDRLADRAAQPRTTKSSDTTGEDVV